MGAPRVRRGGGWRKSGLRAAFVALLAVAFVTGQQISALADDPLQQALKQKEDLERAVAQSRANVERYKDAASQFQAAVSAANSRIADLSEQEDAAQSQADALALEIQIREEQLALVSFQMTETKALADSLNAQAAEERQQLTIREDLYAKHLRTTYRQALISPLEMLLSSKSLTDFANRIQAMIFVNRQDKQLANDINTLRADTATKLADASAKEKDILGLQKQIDDQKASLGKQKAEYEKLVADMRSNIAQQADLRGGAATNRDSQLASAANAKNETAQLNKGIALLNLQKLPEAQQALEAAAVTQVRLLRWVQR